jgi:DNA-binding beta-propeller fold protein YncE
MRNALALLAWCALAAIASGQDAKPFPDYQPLADWAKPPADLKLGQVSAVATDSDDHVYILHRSKLRPIVVFDRDGKYLRSWGDDLYKTPHGLRVGPSNSVWTTDMSNHLVRKFDAEGKLLMTLGKRDEPGAGPDRFNRPTDVAEAPTGEFYVSDGYGNSRVVKFSKEGKFIKEWGKKGTGPGEFNLPHAIVLDDKGRVYVGDRENKRVQIFDGDGKFLDQWKESGSPYGLFLYKQQLFVSDAVNEWVKVLGMDGKPIGRWGQKGSAPGQFNSPHMICVDSRGSVYVADILNNRVQKFVAR